MIEGMKKIFDHTRRGNENIAESLFLPVTIVCSLLAILIFWSSDSIALVGPRSIGQLVLIFGVVLSAMVFTPCYLYGLHLHKEGLSKKQLIFNTLTLTLAVMVTTALLTVLAVALVSQSFKELTLDRYLSAIIVGVYSGLVVYLWVPAVIHMSTHSIVRMFSVVMVCGVMLSMITATNPLWWQINFSSLGSAGTPSSFAFNFTLILSGLLLITLSSHLLEDIHMLAVAKPHNQMKTRFLKVCFILIGVSMAGVGVFTYAAHPALHNLSAYTMVAIFAVLVICIHKVLPFLDPPFLFNSYLALAVIGLCYYLFMRVGYLNLTAFELLAFGITFAWLIVFVRKISSLQSTTTR